MKFTRFQIMEILEILNGFNEKMNKYFVYYVSKIKNELESEKQAILAMSNPSQDFIIFENKRRDIISKYMEIVDGKPVEQNGMYKIQEGKEKECQNELTKLFDENKETIEQRQKEIKELEKIMDEEIDVNVTLIPFGYLPDMIDQKSIDVLMPIIKMNEIE